MYFGDMIAENQVIVNYKYKNAAQGLALRGIALRWISG